MQALNHLIQSLLWEPTVDKSIDSLPVKTNALGFDPWGFSPRQSKLYYSLAYRIYQYFRPEIFGIENIPAGRVLVVPNHSGQLPFDGLVIAVACLLHATPPRLVRPMVERWFPTLPVVNTAFSRSGAVLGDPINCRNLLQADNAILVFPEGARGSGKTWDHRYQLVEFGRGFMRLALATNTSIVPVAVVGSEEQAPAFNCRPLARLLGVPAFPIMPFPPFFPALPLPSRYHIHFGEPLCFVGHPDDDDEQIEQLVKHVRLTIESMLRVGLKSRRSVFF